MNYPRSYSRALKYARWRHPSEVRQWAEDLQTNYLPHYNPEEIDPATNLYITRHLFSTERMRKFLDSGSSDSSNATLASDMARRSGRSEVDLDKIHPQTLGYMESRLRGLHSMLLEALADEDHPYHELAKEIDDNDPLDSGYAKKELANDFYHAVQGEDALESHGYLSEHNYDSLHHLMTHFDPVEFYEGIDGKFHHEGSPVEMPPSKEWRDSGEDDDSDWGGGDPDSPVDPKPEPQPHSSPTPSPSLAF